MISKKPIPTISKVSDMSEGMKRFVGKRVTKKVKFMDEEVVISKLFLSEVKKIQAAAKAAEADNEQGLEALKEIIRSAVSGAEDLSEDDFDNLPLDELTKLSNEIMKFSGIDTSGK
jgi:hypothetical protein